VNLLHVTDHPIGSYRDLVVWQKAMELAGMVSDFCDVIAGPRTYALVDQLDRASTSIAGNIAEGYGRHSRGDYLRFVGIANGSLKELETYLLMAKRRRLPPEPIEGMLAVASEVGRLLTGLLRALRRPRKEGPDQPTP
jgi:four helix bundle protein